MKTDTFSRRNFLKEASMAASALWMGTQSIGASERKPRGALHLASNQYSWVTFYGRDNRNFNESLDDGLKDVAASGLDGYEPIILSPQQIDELEPLLQKHGLEMRSLYVNSTLHEPEKAEQSIEDISAIAERAKEAGAKIIVTNPNPIRWGGTESKNDSQLKVQAAALEKLGDKLYALGLTLAYHNHDAELRNAAREFHHMMVGTDPKCVTLCLDAHWIYRGSGNSAVAVLDIVKLYGCRISELHLRQSVNDIWSETFGEGDIDYRKIVEHLLSIDVKPHLVMEQAVEQGTPKTMDPVEVHRESSEYVRLMFGPFAG